MSQYPSNPQDPSNLPPYDPYGAQGYQNVPSQPKPGSITVLAVFAIIIGGLGSLCTGFGTIVGLMQLAGLNLFQGTTGQIKVPPGIQGFGVFSGVLELVLWVTLLMIGISALSLKPWARQTATSWWSVVMLVWAVVRVILQFTWLGPAQLALAKQMQQPNPAISPQAMDSIMNATLIGQAIFYLLIQVVMPILFLMLWRRPAVAAAFESNAPSGFPVAPGNPQGS